MDWIADVDRWDRLLHSGGVTDAERAERIVAIMNAYVQAEKALRIARRDAEAAALLHTGAAALAERQGCHRATVYRRAERGRMRQKG